MRPETRSFARPPTPPTCSTEPSANNRCDNSTRPGRIMGSSELRRGRSSPPLPAGISPLGIVPVLSVKSGGFLGESRSPRPHGRGILLGRGLVLVRRSFFFFFRGSPSNSTPLPVRLQERRWSNLFQSAGRHDGLRASRVAPRRVGAVVLVVFVARGYFTGPRGRWG